MRKTNRQSKGEGEDMGGTQLRSRMDKREREKMAKDIQSRVMKAGEDPDFRNREEIAKMRQRAETYKKSIASKPAWETPEQLSRRLKGGRG